MRIDNVGKKKKRKTIMKIFILMVRESHKIRLNRFGGRGAVVLSVVLVLISSCCRRVCTGGDM